MTWLMKHKSVICIYEGCRFQPGIGSMYSSAIPFYVVGGAFVIAGAICLSLLFLL
jgi:hypothetical protein